MLLFEVILSDRNRGKIVIMYDLGMSCRKMWNEKKLVGDEVCDGEGDKREFLFLKRLFEGLICI